jgi:RNA-directed DNA polymerase
MYDWQEIPWPMVERKIHKLQRRIYRASLQGQTKKVHALQRLLLRSWYAKLLAVRRVTQDNQGKKTPGIDGVANLGPEERLDLVNTLNLEAKPQPIRRVWIPKPGSDEQRPLGIPTLHDRAAQAWVKLALEPEWEAKFEPNSYGFRPGRSCHDAIEAIFLNIQFRAKFVLDADIAQCFDRICQQALLTKLNTLPQLQRLIRAWLEAGVLDGNQLFPTTQGVCQGGVISPLLANIALHGLETAITQAFPARKLVDGQLVNWKPSVIRYADDLVILHPDLQVVQRCQELSQAWLAGMGLELKPSKTRIRHTLQPREGEIGFDFLGFKVRQFQVGTSHRITNPQGQRLSFRTRMQPSKAKVKLHHQRLADIARHHRTAPQEALIAKLNPLIRGWCYYYRTVASSATFKHCDNNLYHVLRRWTRRRHPNKSGKWVARKYWRLPHWSFAPPKGTALYRHQATHIVRHIKVQGTRSPYDGDWGYWAGRMGRYPGLPPWVAMRLRAQGGKCAHCGLYFRPGDLVEIHHEDNNHDNNHKGNLVGLHRHCHDDRHGANRFGLKGSVRDKEDLSEEPYECESLTYGSEDQPGG